MDDQVIPSLNRRATIETVVPTTRTAPAAPVYLPTPVIVAPPPRVELIVKPPGDIQPPAPNNPTPAISTFTLGDPAPVQSNNLAPDISTYVSSNEPYFQLSSTVAPVIPDTWYEYPSQTGSVLFDNTVPPGPLPVQFGTLHAFGQDISYQNQSLLPSTWYLNPSLNGEITLVDASGSQLLHSIDANLYYNNELLAKANDIQDIADWSLYPALQSVDFDNNAITNASDVASATATIGTISGGSIGITGAITAGATGTFGSVSTAGAVSAASITTTGAGTFGSVGTTGSGTFGSLTSNGIINAASHQIQNATALTIGPSAVGTLSSPDGTVLTWNGNAITTGTEGDAANWANYPAVNTITGLSTTPLTIQPGANQPLNIQAPDTAINNNTGGSYNVTVDKGINVVAAANVDITAQNGSGGNISLNAQPGYQLLSQQVGYGAIQLNAFGSSNQLLGLGGKIDINAYSGGLGEYGSATSRVSISSATIALSAGAAPPLPGTAGSMNIFGQDIVSIVASLIPPVLPQFPNSVYIYGDGVPFIAGGVRLSSPNGVQIADNSELYATDIYPYTSNGLNLKGRASIPGPAADVTIADCASIDMRSAATIAGVNSLTMAGPGTISSVKAITADAGNLTIQGSGLITPYLVSLANVNTIAFEPSVSGGTGALTGVQTINGVAYPPPSGDSSDWASFPAIQPVDMSGNGITNLASITTLTNASITSAGSLSIFSDAADLSLAADNGGNVNIGTGNAGSINITTAGTGHNLLLSGDVASLTGATGANLETLAGSVSIVAPTSVIFGTPTLDVAGADITNVANITNESTNPLSLVSSAALIMSSETAASMGSNTDSVSIQAQTDANIYAATGNVNLTADSGEVIVQDSVLNMNTHKITNLTAGTAGTDAVNLTQLTFRDSTEFYVSSQGSNANNGSILAPFLTIQAAITAAEAISSAALVCVINVASGHYTENLTFNKGYVVLNGTLQSQTGNEVCEITGSISIACVGADDVFNRQVTFQGFNITCGAGQAITDTSTAAHTVSFQDVKAFVNNQFYVSTSTATDMRVYMTNVEIQQTNAGATLPIIATNVGQLEFERLDASVSGNCSAIVVGGTSILSRFSLSALETTNASATLLPLLSFTSSTTSTHTLGNVAFAFSSATAKTATSAVYIASGVNTLLLMLNNVFTLTGTASSTNYTVGYNGVGSPAILGVNNTSLNVNVLLPQTTAVQTGISQVAYTDMNPPNMACYSTTGDQNIAAQNTPQVVTFNTTQFQQGTSLVATSRFYVSSQGNYQITWSLCLSHSSGTAVVTSFLKKNATTVANTGAQTTTFNGATSLIQVSPNFIVSLNAGDYVELWWGSTTIGSSINSTGATNGNAATPGAVFNITQIR